jgi:type IV pilus assembly protein PilO
MSVAGIGTFYYYYEMPARAEMAKQEKQLKSLRADLDKARATAKKLPEFRAEVGNLEHRLETLRAVLPEEKDAADLLRRLQTVAMQSNLVIMGFKPAPIVTKQVHAEWPITLELEGNYHNLAAFFDRLGKFTRIVNISGLEVRSKENKAQPTVTIAAKCVATTFVLLDKAAIEAAKEKAQAKAGKPAPKPAAPAKKVA